MRFGSASRRLIQAALEESGKTSEGGSTDMARFWDLLTKTAMPAHKKVQ